MGHYLRLLSTLMLAAVLSFTGCDEKIDNKNSLLMLLGLASASGTGGTGDTGGTNDTVVNIAAIPGVMVPVRGETPLITPIETAQYIGIITWSPNNNPFKPETVYTAYITLIAKSGFTLTGVVANYFTVAGAATVTNAADSGTVTAVFAVTGAVPDIDVDFQSATQTGGSSGTVNSTGLTLTFDADPATLTEDSITVTGATKGVLTGTGTTRSLAISNITVADGETVTVTIASPAGYAITGSPRTAAVYRNSFFMAMEPGEQVTVRTGGVSFRMSFAFHLTSIAFPTGTGDGGNAIINSRFFMGETEVTYELWYAVRQWALSHGYAFQNPGAEGSMGTIGAAPSGNNQHPVTRVSWRDAVIWCNALSEMAGVEAVYVANGTNGTTIGAILRSSADNAYGGRNVEDVVRSESISVARKGFRLPTSNEWEYAARYRGSDSTNSVAGYTNPYFIQGDSASGATADYNDATATGLVAWYNGNSSSTHPVKGKAANALGLHDMSGNVWEWCFTAIGSNRVLRGGDWWNNASYLQVGYWLNGNTNGLDDNLGFRFAKSW